jgi:hypothetical protein
MGGGGGSSSQADQTTTTQSFDNRIVNESGVVATGGSTIIASIEHMDGDIVKAALDFATDANETNSVAFDKLVEFAADVFTKGATMLQTGQDTVLSAMQTAENDKKGAIDQKTIMVLAGVAAIAYTMTTGKK